MKNFIIILFLLFTMTNSLYGQKIKNKISKSVCNCLSELVKNGEGIDSDEPVEMCLQPLLVKYAKELRKEYGDDFFDTSNSKALHDFGVELGLIIASDCDIFMKLMSDELKNERDLSESLYNEAEDKMEKGLKEEAIELYNQAIAIDPEESNYFNSRGVAHFQLENHYKAIGDFYRALELDPSNHDAQYNCSYTMYTMGDMVSALKEINLAIHIDPKSCDSYNLKGLIFDYHDLVDSALVYFKKAHACDTSNTTYNYNLGYSNYRNRNYSEALQHFLESYEIDSTNKNLSSYIGISYEKMEDYQNAIFYHTQSIELTNSEDYIPFFNRALAYYNGNDYELAYNDLKMAFKLDSTDHDVIEYLARSLFELKKYKEALDYMNQLIGMDTDNANYYDYRALVNKQLENHEDAIRDYQVSLSLYPDDCKIHEYLGDLYTLIDKKDKAKVSYQKSKSMGCEDE